MKPSGLDVCLVCKHAAGYDGVFLAQDFCLCRKCAVSVKVIIEHWLSNQLVTGGAQHWPG